MLAPLESGKPLPTHPSVRAFSYGPVARVLPEETTLDPRATCTGRMLHLPGDVIKSLSKEGGKPRRTAYKANPRTAGTHSHSTNPIIWGCISYTFTVITFANLLIFYLLFLAANFFSIKIVSQKAGEYNYLLHRFPGYSAIENTLIYRKFSFIALDAFRSGRSRHPWTL